MKCHLFFECLYLSQIWNATTALINLNNVPDKWLDIIDLLKQATRGKSIWYVIRRLVLASTVYRIWIEKNNRIFKDKRRPFETMVNTIANEVRSRLKSLNLKASPNIAKAKIHWRLPIKNKDIATQYSP